MVFPYHSVAWFEWHITNNPDNISDETKKLWVHYKWLQKHNTELIGLLRQKCYTEMSPEDHRKWLVEADKLIGD